MQFFIPQVASPHSETVYQELIAIIKDQLRLTMTERRIFKLHYARGKMRHVAQVGELDPAETHYQVLAIFESSLYVVFARLADSDRAITILVDKDEVTTVVDFE